MAGGWTNQITDEVTAPSTLPFLPGFDIVGIGVTNPPELTAVGITAALVFYTSVWNPAATTPTVKFLFIGTQAGVLVFGIGYCVNPSANPTATVTVSAITGSEVVSGTVRNLLTIGNTSGKKAVKMGEDASGIGYLFAYLANNVPYFLVGNDSVNGTDVLQLCHTDGTVSLGMDSASELLVIPAGDHRGLSAWANCTLVNGWSATASPSFNRQSGVQARRFPDGTVRLRGCATPGITTAGTYICQLPSSDYWPAAGQIVSLYTVGTTCRVVIDSGNGAITLLAGGTPNTEVEFDCSWNIL